MSERLDRAVADYRRRALWDAQLIREGRVPGEVEHRWCCDNPMVSVGSLSLSWECRHCERLLHLPPTEATLSGRTGDTDAR